MIKTVSVILLIGIVILALGFAVGLDALLNKVEENAHPREYGEYVSKYAKEYNIPEYVIYAIIKVESNFSPTARSSAGAMGLMQMTEPTFLWLTGGEHLGEYLPVESLYIPDVSIRYGTYYLLYLYRKFDYNLDTALAAYNAGEGNVAAWLGDPEYSDGDGSLKKIPYSETRAYVSKVNDAIDTYKELYYQSNEGVLV